MGHKQEGDIVAFLTDAAQRVPSAHFRGSPRDWDGPGLYCWWVDAVGAGDLARGIGEELHAGLLYAGQAGAGKSKSTLKSRIAFHQGRDVSSSTLRHSLAAVLHSAGDSGVTPGAPAPKALEQKINEWMNAHLELSVCPLDARDSLKEQETQVLAKLDPPFNLKGMPITPFRARLKFLRKQFKKLAMSR